MVLQDANCKIRAVWGGYTPKLHDGEFLKLQQDWIKEHLAGATIIGDNHFSWGNTLNNVKFVTPKACARGDATTMEGVQQLTKEDKKNNKLIHATCARAVWEDEGDLHSLEGSLCRWGGTAYLCLLDSCWSSQQPCIDEYMV